MILDLLYIAEQIRVNINKETKKVGKQGAILLLEMIGYHSPFSFYDIFHF